MCNGNERFTLFLQNSNCKITPATKQQDDFNSPLAFRILMMHGFPSPTEQTIPSAPTLLGIKCIFSIGRESSRQIKNPLSEKH